MRYHSWYDREWAQIEMYAITTAAAGDSLPSFGTSFKWAKEEPILVEISRKFDPTVCNNSSSSFDLAPIAHFTDPNQWFSLLLLKKRFVTVACQDAIRPLCVGCV